jgi:hypothetical protein
LQCVMIAQQLHQKSQMQERFVIGFEFNNWGEWEGYNPPHPPCFSADASSSYC